MLPSTAQNVSVNASFLNAEGAQSVSPAEGPAARALWEGDMCPRSGEAWRFTLPALRTPGAGILGAPGTRAVSCVWARYLRAQDGNLLGGQIQCPPILEDGPEPQVNLD